MPISDSTGISAELDFYQAAFDELTQIIMLQQAALQNTDQANRVRARAAAQISFLAEILNQITAGSVVVNPPTAAQISSVQNLIAAVTNLSLADGLLNSSITFIDQAIQQASPITAQSSIKPAASGQV